MNEYTLVIKYTLPPERPPLKRTIPWRWYPSASEVFECIRRLRDQLPDANVVSVTLYETRTIEQYDVGE